MRLVFLDTGPLGVLTNPKGTPEALACQQWVRDLLAAKVRVVVPAIADYELRRELIRAGKIAGLRRLDAVRMGLEFDPITQAALDRAAELGQSSGLAASPPRRTRRSTETPSLRLRPSLRSVLATSSRSPRTTSGISAGSSTPRFGRRSSPESSARALLRDRSRHDLAALRSNRRVRTRTDGPL